MRPKKSNNDYVSSPLGSRNAGGRLLSRADTAHFFGVAPTTVDAWIRKGCPVVKAATGPGSGRNRWQLDSADVAEWRRKVAMEEILDDVEVLDVDKARARKMTAEAALAEYDLAERRQQTMLIEDIASVVSSEYATCRTRILAIPAKIAPRLASIPSPAEIQRLLEGELTSALAELSYGAVEDDDGSSNDGGGQGVPGARAPKRARKKPEAAAPADGQ